jgi:hypothetical protein
MNKPWKVARAFQNNGPDYFVVTNGTWGARKIACLDEPSAETVRDLLTALERLYAWVDNNVAYGLPDKERAGIDATLAKAKGRE